MKNVRVLSTRKLAFNQKGYLLNAGIQLLEVDFITIRHKTISSDQKQLNRFLLITSQNAVKSILEQFPKSELSNKEVFCVGQKTKALLEENHINVVAWAEYAETLSELIVQNYSDREFTFFCGNLRRNTLPNALQLASIKYAEIEVYETILQPQRISTPLDGILFYSPSGVESYFNSNDYNNETLFCIGTTTANALIKRGFNKIKTAKHPTIENVIIQCIKYYK